MATPLRSLGHRATFPSAVRGSFPHPVFRATATRAVHLHTNPEDSSQDGHEDTGVRERAIKARQPSYAGWWTEILNYHTTPQTSVDPSAFNIPDNKKDTTASSPSADEIKKGYGNTLPRGKPPSLEYNTLPRAASTGSATFVTGTGSTLSAPAAEYTDYHGFKVPIKPSPPGAEDCCMSGCAHCIYDIYEEDRQEFKTKLARTLHEISKAGLPPPPNISNKKGDSIGASADNAQSTNDEDDDMDPGMKAFLELERKLKGS